MRYLASQDCLQEIRAEILNKYNQWLSSYNEMYLKNINKSKLDRRMRKIYEGIEKLQFMRMMENNPHDTN